MSILQALSFNIQMTTIVNKTVCVTADKCTIHSGCGTVMIDIKQGSTVRYHAQVENADLDDFIKALQEYKIQLENKHTL